MKCDQNFGEWLTIIFENQAYCVFEPNFGYMINLSMEVVKRRRNNSEKQPCFGN